MSGNPIPPIIREALAIRPRRSRELEALGLSRERLRQLVGARAVLRLRRGVYAAPDFDLTAHHTLALAARQVPAGIICLLSALAYHELTTLYALHCIERLILDGKSQIEVKKEPYWRYNRLVDARNATKVWSDPRSQSYYWNARYGRTAGMNPFSGEENWNFMRNPDFDDLKIG